MAMNIESLLKATKTVTGTTAVVFVSNESRSQARSLCWGANVFRGNHSKIAFEKTQSGSYLNAETFRDILTDSLGEELEWGGNLGQGPVYTTTEQTEVAIIDHYRDSNGEIVAYFYNEAENELLFFITG